MSKLVPQSPPFSGGCPCWNLIGMSEHACQSPGLAPYCEYTTLKELLKVMEVQFDSEDLWCAESPCWNYISVFWKTSLSLVEGTDLSTGDCWKGGRATGVTLTQSPNSQWKSKGILLTWSVYHSATCLSDDDSGCCQVPAVQAKLVVGVCSAGRQVAQGQRGAPDDTDPAPHSNTKKKMLLTST